MTEVPINYLETAGDQQESRREVWKRHSSERVPGSSGESGSHLRHIPQLLPLGEGCWGALIPHIPILSGILSQWLGKVRKVIDKEMQMLVVEVVSLR